MRLSFQSLKSSCPASLISREVIKMYMTRMENRPLVTIPPCFSLPGVCHHLHTLQCTTDVYLVLFLFYVFADQSADTKCLGFLHCLGCAFGAGAKEWGLAWNCSWPTISHEWKHIIYLIAQAKSSLTWQQDRFHHRSFNHLDIAVPTKFIAAKRGPFSS